MSAKAAISTATAKARNFADVEAARQEAINSVREILGEKLLHGGALNHRSIEIADETGHVVEVVNSRDVLFKDGRFRSYSDDITQSAASETRRANRRRRASSPSGFDQPEKIFFARTRQIGSGGLGSPPRMGMIAADDDAAVGARRACRQRYGRRGSISNRSGVRARLRAG